MADDETPDVVASFTEEIATALVGDAVEPSEGQADETEGIVQEEAVEESEGFSLVIPELPEELAEELNRAEIDLEVEAEEPEEEEEWYDDGQEVTKLKAELAKAKKREKYLEEQNIKTGTPGWSVDAKKYFPLSVNGLDKIQAKSKRDFLRQAKEIHDQLLPTYTMMQGDFDKRLATEREKLKVEAVKEVQEAWGIPTTITGTEPAPASGAREKIQSVRKSRSLAETIKRRL